MYRTSQCQCCELAWHVCGLSCQMPRYITVTWSKSYFTSPYQ